MKHQARQLVLTVIFALCTALPTGVRAETELPTGVRAETETIDLKALAKKARPAVMLLVVSDANGKEIATGTGFLVSSDGKLITNHHVIESGASVVAKAENGGLFPVEGVLSDDPKNDLVLLKLKGKDLPFLTLSTNATTEVGTRVAVIGSPLGLEGTLSEGIVSAVREHETGRSIQITAAISHGSSGSPVLSAGGEVIGVAAALVREGQSLNFAVPVFAAGSLLAKAERAVTPKPFANYTNDKEGAFDDLLQNSDFLAYMEADGKGNYAEALSRIKSVLARFPNSGLAYFQLGKVYASLTFSDEAAQAYEQAGRLFKQSIKTRPDDVDAWIGLGDLYGAEGRSADEIIAYKEAVKIAPFPVQWWLLGAAYMNAGDYPNAVTAYQQGVKSASENFPRDDIANVMALDRLGSAYYSAAQWANAIDAYKQSIKLRPKSRPAWSGLGLAYHMNGQEQEAEEAFRRLKELTSKTTQEDPKVLPGKLK